MKKFQFFTNHKGELLKVSGQWASELTPRPDDHDEQELGSWEPEWYTYCTPSHLELLSQGWEPVTNDQAFEICDTIYEAANLMPNEEDFLPMINSTSFEMFAETSTLIFGYLDGGPAVYDPEADEWLEGEGHYPGVILEGEKWRLDPTAKWELRFAEMESAGCLVGTLEELQHNLYNHRKLSSFVNWEELGRQLQAAAKRGQGEVGGNPDVGNGRLVYKIKMTPAQRHCSDCGARFERRWGTVTDGPHSYKVYESVHCSECWRSHTESGLSYSGWFPTKDEAVRLASRLSSPEAPAPTKKIEVNADLSGQDLSGQDLSRKSLVGANLTGCTMVETDLRGARLQSANLNGAELYKANLNHANLNHADLMGCDLRGVDFRGADLQHANLKNSDLYRANFDGAKLDGTGIAILRFGATRVVVTPESIVLDYSGDMSHDQFLLLGKEELKHMEHGWFDWRSRPAVLAAIEWAKAHGWPTQ